MKKITLCIAAAGFLAGCSSLGLPTPKTPKQAVYAADAGFLAAVTVADNYKNLPSCGATASPICADQAVVAKIRLSANAADATLKAAEATVQDPHFAGSASDAAIVAATNAVAAFVAVTQQLKTQ
jgi:hypothetical protein